MKNPLQVVISQYLNSPAMLALLGDWNDNLDPQADLFMFYSVIWNINTASGYGLDVWGRIVGVDRFVQSGTSTDVWLGFAGSAFQPFGGPPSSEPGFGGGVFYDGSALAPTFTTLSDSFFRILILLKAFVNLSNCSAKTLNIILNMLYAARGQCFVIDNLNMSFTYIFNFPMTADDFAVLSNGILAGPAGVSYTIIQGV